MITPTLLLSLFASQPAQAFCGTYVGAANAELFNSASQVAMVREGSRTTLTMANNVQGNAAEFAMVLPVPQVLGPEDVRVTDPELFARLDGYSAPRLVRYSCDDFNRGGDTAVAFDASEDETSTGDDAQGSVTVEAEFTAGEYDIVILSAQESSGLLTWLDDHQYAVSAEAETLLQEYIDAGSYFLAARVSLTLGQEGQVSGYLSPLQLSYDSEVFSLPVRLGTLNSPGHQDLVLYLLTSDSDGEVRVSNYPQVEVADECLWDEASMGTFGDFYQQAFTDAMADNGAAWALEYSWTTSGCDPCSQEPLSEEELRSLGFAGDPWASHFTRLHARYSAEAAEQDLLLYGSNEQAAEQVRYIEYAQEMEDRFPLCGSGWATDPGSCDSVGQEADPDGQVDGSDAKLEPRFSCSAQPTSAPMGAGLALLLLGLLRRRRPARST